MLCVPGAAGVDRTDRTTLCAAAGAPSYVQGCSLPRAPGGDDDAAPSLRGGQASALKHPWGRAKRPASAGPTLAWLVGSRFKGQYGLPATKECYPPCAAADGAPVTGCGTRHAAASCRAQLRGTRRPACWGSSAFSRLAHCRPQPMTHDCYTTGAYVAIAPTGPAPRSCHTGVVQRQPACRCQARARGEGGEFMSEPRSRLARRIIRCIMVATSDICHHGRSSPSQRP